MQFERRFVPSAVVDCLCLFPKTEAAMALGGLLLLLQVGITRAWKERSTLGEGREMERGTATTPRKSLETRQVRDPAIEEVRRTAKLSSAKSNSKVLFNSRPGKISLSKLSRPDQPRTYARLASYVLPFCEEPQTVSSAQHLQHLEYPRHSPDHIHGGNTATLNR